MQILTMEFTDLRYNAGDSSFVPRNRTDAELAKVVTSCCSITPLIEKGLNTIDTIRSSSTILKEMENNGEIEIEGAFYKLKTGGVTFF